MLSISFVFCRKTGFLKRIFLSLCLLFSAQLYAQEHHELGIMGGVANYYGDLQPSLLPSYGYKPVAGILYKYFISPFIGLRCGATYNSLTASDSRSDIAADRARNLSFSTTVYELHAALEINFRPIEVKKKKFTPYIFGGISAFYFNPYATDNAGNKVFLKPLSTEGEGLSMYPDRKPYSLVNMAFPIGGGLKFLMGKRMILCVEMGYRYTNTDYLDDVSKSYVDLNVLQANRGTLAAQMSYRGNTASGWNGTYPNYGVARGDNQANDWYWYGTISLCVFFHSRSFEADYINTKCPKVFR